MPEVSTKGFHRVIVNGQRPAFERRLDFVGTEQLLVGLFEDREGMGVRLLKAMGRNVNKIEREAREAMALGQAPITEASMTPRAKTVVNFAIEAAQQFVGRLPVLTKGAALQQDRGDEQTDSVFETESVSGSLPPNVGVHRKRYGGWLRNRIDCKRMIHDNSSFKESILVHGQ